MLPMTAEERRLIERAPVLTPDTRIQICSLADPNDVRLELDTSARDYDRERAGITEGQVTCDVGNDAIRSLSLTLVDHTRAWWPRAGGAVWLDALVKIWRSYDGFQSWWSQGWYALADPEMPRGNTVQLQGVDKTCLANGRPAGGFQGVFRVTGGVNLRAALEAVAGYPTWGETRLNLGETTEVMPYTREWQVSNNPWEAFREIAGIPGDRRSYYDGDGWLRWEADPDPTTLAPVWTVGPQMAADGAFSLYISAAKRIDDSGLKNWVGVIGGGAVAAPVYAYAEDADPGSAVSTARIGHRMHWHNGGRPDPLITTVDLAQARANYELRRLKQFHERIPLRVAEMPWLEPWDVLRITDASMGIDDTYQVTSLTVPLAGEAESQITGWRVRPL